MKTTFTFHAAMLVSLLATYGQGQVSINNRVVPDVIARFIGSNDPTDGSESSIGSDGFTVNLLGGPAGTALAQLKPLVPATTTFRGSAGTAAAGYFRGVTATVSDVNVNGRADIIVEVVGATVQGGKQDFGPFRITLGGGQAVPPNLRMGTSPLVVNVTGNILVSNPQEDHSSRNTQNEPSIVISPRGNIVVAFNDSGSLGAATNQFTGWSVSTNGGQSFEDMGALPHDPRGDGGDPVLASDNAGGVVYLNTIQNPTGAGLQLFRSLDDGLTFEPPVNPAPGFASGDQLDKPWLAVDNSAGFGNGNVYLAFRDFPSGQNGSQQPLIYFNVSTNQGLLWGVPRILGAGQGAYVVVGPQHQTYVFWLAAQRILLAKSVDSGTQFNLTKTVASISSTAANGDLGLNYRTDSFPRVAVNPVSGDLYVVYNDKGANSGDLADIFFTMSSDEGVTWTTPHRVNQDATTHSQWFPCITVSPDGRNLLIAWYDRRLETGNSEAETVFGVLGTISGALVWLGNDFQIGTRLFGPPQTADPSIATPFGDYFQAVAGDSRFYIAWTDIRLGDPDVWLQAIPIPDRFAISLSRLSGFELKLTTNPGISYDIEYSTDLQNWTQWQSFVADALTRVLATNVVLTGHGFNRAAISSSSPARTP